MSDQEIRPDGEVWVNTVLGRIAPSELGVTLPHEHLLFDETTHLTRASDAEDVPVTPATIGELHRNRNVSFENLKSDENLALSELGLFQAAGGSTVVDLSPPGLGRDVLGLKRLAAATGVNIIAPTGYYCAFSHPADVASKSVDEIAAWMIREIVDGIDDTGVRAGVIGELGITPGGGHPDEWKVMHAAALTQQETGVAISVHNALPHERQGMKAIRLLTRAGADPERVIMGHMTQSTPDLEYHRRIADTGAILEYDKFGTEFYYDESGGAYDVLHPWPRDSEVVLHIANLVRLGYADQILLSHDAGRRISLAAYGGYGLAHVPGRIVRYLAMAGVASAEIEKMTTGTPARLFTVRR